MVVIQNHHTMDQEEMADLEAALHMLVQLDPVLMDKVIMEETDKVHLTTPVVVVEEHQQQVPTLVVHRQVLEEQV